ncbi:MAG: hypothetical protein SLAVMIC_00599 [uncultured marine phage]|uniref:Uncharacterized protein n=1 Tax=uncultured marine phage TaxID=707152 RepID=A0A8D9FQC8_9VIRU|nr:MAG: hypothetical protein SLAVMIC_00599 [uncultured marine phage]
MAKQFGQSRSRKDIHDEYLLRKNNTDSPTRKIFNDAGEIESEHNYIGNVNTLSNFDSNVTGRNQTPAPPSPENLRYSHNVSFLRNYFKDGQTHHFKNGLELANSTGNKDNVSNIENLDEDPIIFGFDFIVNQISSPLYTELPDFFTFAQANGLTEVVNRQDIYNDFIEHFELLFLSTRGGAFDTFKGHYLVGVDGLGDLINQSTGLGSTKQFADFGKDKITLTLREDSHLSGGYLTMLYNTLSYSKINGKQMIPNNLLRFDATIVISEIRNFKRIRTALATEDGATREVVKMVNDSVSRYMYNVYDCQFTFNKHSHPGAVKNDQAEAADTFDINFFYKYSSMEMEKFKFDPTAIISKYLNDGNREDPRKKYVGEVADDVNAVRRNEFINAGYQENTDPYAIYDIPTSNNIERGKIVSINDSDEISTLKHNSEINSKRIREEEQAEKNEGTMAKVEAEKLKNDVTMSGYEKTDANKETVTEGLQGIINNTKDFALSKARRKRDSLINGTLQNIRTSTGLRRINSPINVYHDNTSVFGFLRNELRDFTNNRFTGLIGGIDDIV